MLVFAGVCLPVTLALGFWQLAREEEKALLLASMAANEQAPPVALKALSAGGDHNYRRVLVSGKFDNRHPIMLQNRVRNGRPGYEVVIPFQERDTGLWLLVNRGWIAGRADNEIPAVDTLEGSVLLSGHLYRSADVPFTLGDEQWRHEWPQILQNLEVDALAERLGVPLFAYVLRLDPESPGALAVGWPKVAIQPQKHRAYAVQWFALATALVVLSIFANSNLGDVMRQLWRKRDE